MKKKVGDTLIEVTLAIGIFSMVAITIAMVVNSSTSGSQVSLETTITREQIDAQAEALRYIHASYIAGGPANDSGEDRYIELWRAIVSRAKNTNSSLNLGDSFDFNPATCEELYTPNANNGNLTLAQQGAFIINTHNLYKLNPAYADDEDTKFDQIVDDILITPPSETDLHANVFFQASTYPRILYREELDANTFEGQENYSTLIAQGVGTEIDRVEGLYIIPIRDYDISNNSSDSGTTIIVTPSDDGNTLITTKAAYYDFYIRSCWFGSGADRPSTISTVIRLYDPNVIEY